MGALLRGWYEAHKKCLTEGLKMSAFIQMWAPKDILEDKGILEKRQDGKKVISKASDILDKDRLRATSKKDAEEDFFVEKNKKKIEAKYVEYAKIIIKCEYEVVKDFLQEIEAVLRNCDRDDKKIKILILALHRINPYNVKSLADFFYNYTYFAIKNKISLNLDYKEFMDYEEDFEEYREKVLESRGPFSLQGMATIYALAEREEEPNVCALYMKGQLEYYGRGPSGKRNIPEAYACYKKCIEENEAHPLALWEVAYLKWHYDEMKDTCAKMGYVFEIEDFEIGKKNPRLWNKGILEGIEKAIGYGSAAAENMLGQIIEAKEERFPERHKGDYKGTDPEVHYKRSAEMGYGHAYINLFEFNCRKAEACTDEEKRNTIYREAFEYMKKAADMGISYAANKISQSYLKGFNGVVNEDEEKAFVYAKKAIRYAKLMTHAYWPFYNIVKYFYGNEESPHFNEVSKEEQIEFLDVAMEAAEGIEDNKYKEFKNKVNILRAEIELQSH